MSREYVFGCAAICEEGPGSARLWGRSSLNQGPSKEEGSGDICCGKAYKNFVMEHGKKGKKH